VQGPAPIRPFALRLVAETHGSQSRRSCPLQQICIAMTEWRSMQTLARASGRFASKVLFMLRVQAIRGKCRDGRQGNSLVAIEGRFLVAVFQMSLTDSCQRNQDATRCRLRKKFPIAASSSARRTSPPRLPAQIRA